VKNLSSEPDFTLDMAYACGIIHMMMDVEDKGHSAMTEPERDFETGFWQEIDNLRRGAVRNIRRF